MTAQKKVLLIDNYDSFTWNLVQLFQECGANVVVRKNDEICAQEAEKINPDFLVFSPGPGTVMKANDVGNGPALLKHFQGKIPILGVCLGHQMIGHFFGGKIKAVEPHHGKKSRIFILKKSDIFKNFPDVIEGMRYHSLAVERKNFPDKLEITAETEDGVIMALAHRKEKIFGVQFHPESIGTKLGRQIVENFLAQ